ncbi:MAG: hypothetical protein M3N10_04395 [Actinomycetota bacterium]|nr:hypothetical protein [Actinomycetota bacterium]
MLLDLIRVLFAALLIGVLPGYYWARTLFATRDFAARLAYGVGLSMALVPAVTLIPACVLGQGVSLSATLFSALLVFGAGIVAYLWSGAEKEPEQPVAQPAKPPGLATLLPLIVALALAVAASLGAVEARWVVFPTAGLVVAAGVAYWFAPGGRRDLPYTSEPEVREQGTSRVRYLLLALVLLFVLGRGYVGPVLQDWPYIRGVDHYSHAVMANQMLSEGTFEAYVIYPPGFHTMTAMISTLSGLEPIDVFPVLGPLLFVLPPLALYALADRLWGWEHGIAAAFFGGLLLGGSYSYLNDSMYPNLVTAQFLLVLAVAAMIHLYAAPSWRTVLATALLGSSVVLYHQVSSLYLALLLAMVAVFLLPYLLFYDRRRGLALFLSLALLTTLSVLYAWDTYNLPQTIAGFLENSETGETGDAVDMAIGTQVPYSPESLVGGIVSEPVMWLGLLGAFLVFGVEKRREKLPQFRAHFTLLLWSLALFAGSVTSLSGFPQRFGRDLGVPLSLLAAFALMAVLRSLGARGSTATLVASLAALLIGVLASLQTLQNFEVAASPSPQMVISEEIYAAGEWLEEHNHGGNIMVSPHVNQVPSRVMLALGDYSGLQSFEPGQIQFPRDLPPTGPEPLWDVLWVMQHPDGPLTQKILEKYDIRYIVLYKNMPDRPTTDLYWQIYESRPDLYRTTFENEAVIVLEPRFT